MAFVQEVNALTGNLPLREICERLYIQVARVVLKMMPDLGLAAEFRAFRQEMVEVLAAAEIGDWDAIGHIRRAHISMSFTRMAAERPRQARQPRGSPCLTPTPASPPTNTPPASRRPAPRWRRRASSCLIVSDPSNMHWLTGYDGWSFYVHQAVVVPPTGNPIWYGRGQDAAGAQRTAWLPDADIVGYPDHYVQSTERHPMDYLAGDARRARPRPAPHRRRDGQLLVLRRRLRRAAAQPARTPASPTPPASSTGSARSRARPRSATCARPPASSRRCTPASPRSPAPACASATSSPRSSTPAPAASTASAATIRRSCRCCPPAPTPPPRTSPGTTSRCRPGEGTFFEIAGCYHRYHCPLSRTVFLGKPTQAFLDAEAATLEGMEAGLAAARPGNTCEDIAKAFFAVLAKHGIVKDNRTGYSIGLSYPPDWGERTMSLRSGDRTELRPGMTFHFMTGLWLETMGLEITESILITETGVECLANVPRKLTRHRLT